MSRLAVAALLFASLQAAWSQDVFPTCNELRQGFAGMRNLFFNGGGIKDIVTTECIEGDGSQDINR